MQINKIFFILLLALSCGRERVQVNNSGMGTYRSLATVEASEEERLEWINICSILEQKNARYNLNYKNVFTRFHFNVQYFDCKGNPAQDDGDVVTKLDINNSVLSYLVVNGNHFTSNVETHDSGLLSTVCAELKKDDKTLNMPIRVNNTAFWFYTSSSSCSSNSNRKCARVERAFKQKDGSYIELIEDQFEISNKAARSWRYFKSSCRRWFNLFYWEKV